jgi:hypothetical protein
VPATSALKATLTTNLPTTAQPTGSRTVEGEITAVGTSVQSVRLLLAGQSQTVTLDGAGHFQASVSLDGLTEGTRELRLVATAADGIRRVVRRPIKIDDTAPTAPATMRLGEVAADGTTPVRWDVPQDPALADGTDGAGIDTITARYRSADGAWSGWQSSDTTGTNVPIEQLGSTIQVKVADKAGNQTTTTHALLPPGTIKSCTIGYDDGQTKMKITDPDVPHWRPQQGVIDGHFTAECYGTYDTVEVTMQWAYGIGGKKYKSHYSPVIHASLPYKDTVSQHLGNDNERLSDLKQYEFNKVSVCPRFAEARDGDGNVEPLKNWVLLGTYKFIRNNAVDSKPQEFHTSTLNPKHMKCPMEWERRQWRMEAYTELAHYAADPRDARKSGTRRYAGSPSHWLKRNLTDPQTPARDQDLIPTAIKFPYGWAAHHVVPVADFGSGSPGLTPSTVDRLRDAMWSCKIHPNAPRNGLFLRDRTLTKYVKGTKRLNQLWKAVLAYDVAHTDGDQHTTYATSTHHYDTQEASSPLYEPALGRVFTGSLPSYTCSDAQRKSMVDRLGRMRALLRSGDTGAETGDF